MSFFNEIKLDSLSTESISSNNGAQLNVTPYSSTGVEGVKLINAYGESIETHNDIDGEPYLGVTALQAVHADDNNSFTGSIAAGASWSGSATSTLGVVGLQFSLIADQNCIVHFDQSPDGDNWDITDSFNYYHDQFGTQTGNGWTVQALNSYLRMRVQNVGNAETTYFRAQTALCPIAEPLPRSLSTEGRLDVEATIRDWNTHRHQKVSPSNESIITARYKLVGPTLIGSELDENFWNEMTASSGNITFPGARVLLSTGTGSTGGAALETVHTGRYVQGTSNEFQSYARFAQNPVTGSWASMGPYNVDNGFFFIIQDESFGVGTRNEGSDTVVWNGSFNGRLGTILNFVPTDLAHYEIDYATGVGDFFVNGNLIHSIVVAADEAMTGTFNLPIRIEIQNSGSLLNNAIDIRGVSVSRIGVQETSPVYAFSDSVANDNRILKRGAGKLVSVVNTDNFGILTLYDGLDNTGNVITIIDCVRILGSIEYNVDFSVGLYMETSTPTAPVVTIVYE